MMSSLIRCCSAFASLMYLNLAAATPSSSYALESLALSPDIRVILGANADFSPQNGCNIINTAYIDTPHTGIIVNTGPSYRYGLAQRALFSPKAETVVFNLNLHPDYFFGNQAYGDTRTYATYTTIRGMQQEGSAYADNLYRLCGDWMQNTESTPARFPLTASRTWHSYPTDDSPLKIAVLDGHTESDMVLVDTRSGVLFAGGLIFHERIPTTPHADIPRWLKSLDDLEGLAIETGVKIWVPSHGPLAMTTSALEQTRAYLTFLDHRLKESAKDGLDLSEVLMLPLPEPFNQWAAANNEYRRNVIHLYPRYEKTALLSFATDAVTPAPKQAGAFLK
jgi:quinoprotein relay system zinc metallohydrolase 1